METVRCNSCKSLKNSSEFYRNKSIKRGFYYICIECTKLKDYPIECECGKLITRKHNIYRHLRTNIHKISSNQMGM